MKRTNIMKVLELLQQRYSSWSLTAVMLWTGNTALLILALQRIGKTYFISSQCKWHWKLEVLPLMSQEERQCELSVPYLWQPDSKECLVLSGRLSWLSDARLGLCGFCSVSLCLYPWILLSLLCYLWMRIWDINLSFISSVRPCLEKCFHISCWPFPSNNNSSGSWNVRYQLVIPWGKTPLIFTI